MKIATTFFAFLVVSAPAVSDELRDLRKAGLEALMSVNPRNQKETISRWLEAECKVLVDKTPSLSPREKDWLSKERADGRAVSAYRAPEYSKDFIRHHAKNCMYSAQQIRKSKTWNREVGYWGVIVQALIQDEWKWHVNNVRANSGLNTLTKEDEASDFLFSTYGRNVYERLILPFLLRPLSEPKR